MTVISITPIVGKKSKKSKVHLSEGVDFCLYDSEIRRLSLREGEELSESVYRDILEEILIPRAKKRAMHLLEKQDRTRFNLTQKLRESGYPQEAIDEAIAYVESWHYLDDARYAADYVRYHQKNKSRLRIKQDLLSKGISKDTIEKALDEGYDSSEEEMIRALLSKRGYDSASADSKERAKTYRFLMSRGFLADHIQKCL